MNVSDFKIFPFKVRSYDNGHYTVTPWHYHKTFTKYKPDDMSWYAYDVEVLSKSRAKFTVYDIGDFCHGGVGDVSGEFECDVDEGDLCDFIDREIKSYACRIEQSEFDAARRLRQSELEMEIRNSLGDALMKTADKMDRAQ